MTTYNNVEHYKHHVEIPNINFNTLLENKKVECKYRIVLPTQELQHEGLMYHTFLLSDFINEDNDINESAIENALSKFFHRIMSSVDWSKNFAIDGPSAMGKTSMIKKKPSNKINKYTNIHKNNSYNNISIASFTYFTLNQELLKNCEGLIFDRSIISNIAYGIAYYIMNIIVNENKTYHTFSSLCEEFINITNMRATLEHLKSEKHQVLIVIDSSYEHYAQRLNNRGYENQSKGEILKSQVYEYWCGQTAAFSYLANILNYHCIDLNVLRTEFPQEVEKVDIINVMCEKFRECYYLYEPTNIVTTSGINPQNTIVNSDEVNRLTISTFVNSNR
ncbi:HgNV_027 [Dikerogammarus haemobaphes nudivirus]|nr:HgNV_027 [Dikerogammarus haemobaphes nudivirus]